MDQRERADKIEPTLAAEPIENAEASEPTDATDRIEPAEPMDRIEPDEPIDRMDPLDPMLKMEPEDPGERDEPAEIRITPFWQAGEQHVKMPPEWDGPEWGWLDQRCGQAAERRIREKEPRG